MTSTAAEHGEKAEEAPAIFRLVKGFNIPALFEATCERSLEDHVELLQDMEIRPDDVILMAFGKSGTHWIWEVTSMLLSGKADYEKRTKEFAMMEATKIEKLESQPSPRVLNSHIPFQLLPRQILEKKVKVIHVYRNVKDVVVSGYFHIRQMAPPDTITFEKVERMMVGPGVVGGDYISYHKEMDEFKKKNPDFPCYTLSFEDTKENPAKVIEGLARFLGVKASPELLQQIADATNFSKMRDADKSKQQRPEMPTVKMYRKGEVGDWKNHLTVAQSERLDAAMTLLKSCDYRFRYTL